VLKVAEKAVIDREVAAYERLKDLQGDIIPHFLGRYPHDDERYSCIVLEKITESEPLLDVCHDEQSTLDYLQRYYPRFLSLAARGVCHNDLFPRNVLHTANGPVIVDFGCATTSIWFRGTKGKNDPFSDTEERKAAGEDIWTFMSDFLRRFEVGERWSAACDDYMSKALLVFRQSINEGRIVRPDLETLYW